MHVVELASFRSRSETMHACMRGSSQLFPDPRATNFLRESDVHMHVCTMHGNATRQGSYHGTLLYASFIAANRHTWRMQRPHDPFLFPSSSFSVQTGSSGAWLDPSGQITVNKL